MVSLPKSYWSTAVWLVNPHLTIYGTKLKKVNILAPVFFKYEVDEHLRIIILTLLLISLSVFGKTKPHIKTYQRLCTLCPSSFQKELRNHQI